MGQAKEAMRNLLRAAYSSDRLGSRRLKKGIRWRDAQLKELHWSKGCRGHQGDFADVIAFRRVTDECSRGVALRPFDSGRNVDAPVPACGPAARAGAAVRGRGRWQRAQY